MNIRFSFGIAGFDFVIGLKKAVRSKKWRTARRRRRRYTARPSTRVRMADLVDSLNTQASAIQQIFRALEEKSGTSQPSVIFDDPPSGERILDLEDE